nr:MAG TPA: hypothetical protein [Caudoviricetes sp.]
MIARIRENRPSVQRCCWGRGGKNLPSYLVSSRMGE